MKFKRIELENVCGYRKAIFELDPNLNMFFGPNGCGKSNILYIANILCSPKRFIGRDMSMYFRKMMFHKDYNPGYQDSYFTTFEHIMKMKGVFEDNKGKEYIVELEADPENISKMEDVSDDPDKLAQYEGLIKKVGVVRNDLPEDKLEYAFLSDADNPSNLSKFQIEESAAEKFLDIAEAVYGYKCALDKKVREKDSQRKEYIWFYTDFIVEKDDDGEGYPNVRVHYRRMSDGERKIATLIKQLCSPLHTDRDIYLVDNIEMHVYMQRHTKLVDKLLEHFPDKQYLATTHSAILVGMSGIKGYLPQKNLIDVIKVRKEGGNAVPVKMPKKRKLQKQS